MRLCPSFNAYLLAEEKERGEDPNDVAAVDALLTGEALVCWADAGDDEAALGDLLKFPTATGEVSMFGMTGRARFPWRCRTVSLPFVRLNAPLKFSKHSENRCASRLLLSSVLQSDSISWTLQDPSNGLGGGRSAKRTDRTRFGWVIGGGGPCTGLGGGRCSFEPFPKLARRVFAWAKPPVLGHGCLMSFDDWRETTRAGTAGDDSAS